MNGEGLVVGAMNIRYASSALHAEAIATYKSIVHAAQLGMSRIILEMDASVLAMSLKSTDVDRSSIGALVVQIRDMMLSEFSSCCDRPAELKRLIKRNRHHLNTSCALA